MSDKIGFYLADITGISSYLADTQQAVQDYEKALSDLALALPYSIDEIRPRFAKMVRESLYDWQTCKALLLRGSATLPEL